MQSKAFHCPVLPSGTCKQDVDCVSPYTTRYTAHGHSEVYKESMTAIYLMSMIFGLACGQVMSFCFPTEYVMHVERKECAYCLTINTTICAGYCMTRDINGKLFLPKYALSQDVCTYRDFMYKTVEIPGCPYHVNPYFSYPVAVSCKCGKCNTDYSDCIHEAIKTNYCTKPQKSYAVGFSI